MARFLLMEIIFVRAGEILARASVLVESLLGDLFANYASMRLMAHAATLDLSHFEAPTFYDRLERARRQTTNRNGLMKKASALACAALLLAALLALGCLAHVRDAGAAEAITLDFDASVIGTLPTGFSSAVTGGGRPAFWIVVEDVTAPSGGKVLAQTSTDKTSFRFPLCVYDGFTVPDVTVSVSFKPVSGTVDQAAGCGASGPRSIQAQHRRQRHLCRG
jgi:hypothetical protein